MWTYKNYTPFALERSWVRDRRGAEIWVVAVKGTFTIASDGSLALADVQEPVRRMPEFAGDPASSSMIYDGDLGHPKPGTDVLVNGQAYTPGGRPATSVDVAIRIGSMAKRLSVTGDRHWTSGAMGPIASPPVPFLRMPLTYERSYGGFARGRSGEVRGFDERNPAGRGFALEPREAIGLPLPNVLYSDSQLTSFRHRPLPASFGAIPPHWHARARLAGTYDERWRLERLPLPPDDFDERFYLSAPADQQISPPLKGGETVDLYNLTPSGRLSFRLPEMSLGFRTLFADGDIVHHRASWHTVIVEPDFPRVMIVWQTALPCHHKVMKLRWTIVYLKRRLSRRPR